MTASVTLDQFSFLSFSPAPVLILNCQDLNIDNILLEPSLLHCLYQVRGGRATHKR